MIASCSREVPERWIVIEEFPRYLASNFGNIYDVEREKLLEQTPDRAGYLRVKLWDGDYRKTVSVHRLIIGAFFDVDMSLFETNHIDGNKQNNCIWNLEFCNRSENMLHAFTKGLAEPVFPPQKIRVRELDKVFDSTGQVDRFLGVSSGSVSKTLRGLQSTCKGYTFERVS